METPQVYKNFNEDKTIEEFEYNISNDIRNLENFKFELNFFKMLLDKPIFKPHAMNIFEKLQAFKNEISVLNKSNSSLIDELNSHAHKIRGKIECEDLACDNFFIQYQVDLENKIFNHKIKIFDFKFTLFQYVESVIIN